MLHTLYAYLDRSLLGLNGTSPKSTLRQISIWKGTIVIACCWLGTGARMQGLLRKQRVPDLAQ